MAREYEIRDYKRVSIITELLYVIGYDNKNEGGNADVLKVPNNVKVSNALLHYLKHF